MTAVGSVSEDHRPRHKRLRWISAAVGLAVALTSGTVAIAAPAYACDNNNHCYALASYTQSNLLGTHATIAPLSPYLVTSSGNFTTDEVWLVASSPSYWVEVGYIANQGNINGVGQGISEFWFDSRPGGGAHGHVLASAPSLTARTFYIMRGSSTSTSYDVGDGSLSATSTSDTSPLVNAEIGSETISNTSCSWAHDYSMSYSTGSGWVAFPSAHFNTDSPQKLTWISSPTNMDAGVPC